MTVRTLFLVASPLSLLLPASEVRADTWVPTGPTGVGMVTAIAAGRASVYAATCNGVYRSDDGAATWHETGLQRRCVVRLAADSQGRADTLYAVVNPFSWVPLRPEPSPMAFSALVLDSELWVSTDGGGTWSQTNVSSGHWLAVDPVHPNTAYVANYSVAYYPVAETHDSGATWSRVADAPDETPLQIAVDPRDGTLYGASGDNLYAYSGRSWISLGLAVTVVAPGSGSDGAVYAAGNQIFCRTTNGMPWTCNATPASTPVTILEIPGPQPPSKRILLLQISGVLASDDGGATFSPAAPNVLGYASAAALDPAGSSVYIGNDVGVFRSVDRGQTWTNASAGLSSMWVRGLAIAPDSPSTIWIGGESRVHDVSQAGPGIFRSTDAGASWTSASAAGEPGDVFSLALDPSSPMRAYAGSVGVVQDTSDGGVTWRKTSQFSSFIHSLAVDPSSPTTVWAGTERALKASHDGGTTWSTALAHSVYALVFDERRPDTIYAGSGWEDSSYYYPFGTGFAVETSRDGGATWSRAGSLAGTGVTALTIDPYSEDVVYAATESGSILRSPDAGATWTRWDSGGLYSSVWTLVADPARAGVLYLGTWTGVYRSIDGGVNWHPYSEGLSPYGSLALTVTPDGRWLYSGTTGGGLFRRDLEFVERMPPIPPTRPTTRKTRTVRRQ